VVSIFDGVEPKDRANVAAHELAKRPTPPEFVRKVDHEGRLRNLRIKIRSISVTERPTGHVWVTVEADAFEGNKRLPVDNPLDFQNPPITVPDGTKRWEKSRKLPDGTDEFIQVDNLKEDLDEAIKLRVTEVILATCLP